LNFFFTASNSNLKKKSFLFLTFLSKSFFFFRFAKDIESKKSYFFRLLKVLYRRLGLKYVVLLIMLLAYGLAGGLLFYYLEAPAERALIVKLTDVCPTFTALINHFLISNVTLSQQLLTQSQIDTINIRNQLYLQNLCSSKIENLLQQYDKSAGINPDKPNHWSWNDYWNAVFYCATIFTTIGYGNMSCRTRRGRIATICYALIGVPYMLVVLNSVGKLIFSSVQEIWERLNLQDSVSAEDELFETFPLYLALLIIFAYIGLCSLIFCLWEEWDYFTAFYFFFISLTTVGLGDEMPDHPHYACRITVGQMLHSLRTDIAINFRMENFLKCHLTV
uniref:Ion_trans_2 domain-containing protein n=1 Tax=Enterobius vermicularis TaxID=51028 RepID=A0A0N4V0H6_ENTVE